MSKTVEELDREAVKLAERHVEAWRKWSSEYLKDMEDFAKRLDDAEIDHVFKIAITKKLLKAMEALTI